MKTQSSFPLSHTHTHSFSNSLNFGPVKGRGEPKGALDHITRTPNAPVGQFLENVPN